MRNRIFSVFTLDNWVGNEKFQNSLLELEVQKNWEKHESTDQNSMKPLLKPLILRTLVPKATAISSLPLVSLTLVISICTVHHLEPCLLYSMGYTKNFYLEVRCNNINTAAAFHLWCWRIPQADHTRKLQANMAVFACCLMCLVSWWITMSVCRGTN